MGIKSIITVNNHRITLGNRNKIWFPRSKITKGQIIDYYHTMGPIIMSHIKNHIIMLQRLPDGIKGESFYQKNAAPYFPSWIKTIPLKKENGQNVDYIIAKNLATLLYLTNHGTLTFHSWQSRADKLDYPDRMIFDLDPSIEDFTSVRKAALLIKDIFDDLKIPSFAMTTGSRGIHIYTPLKRVHTFDQIADFSLLIAQKLLAENPKMFTLEIRKNKRAGKIFIDTLRNRYGATSVVPYSVRPREKAPVAAPLWWPEVKDSRLTSQKFTIKNIIERIKSEGDPWHEVDTYALSLKKHLKKLASEE